MGNDLEMPAPTPTIRMLSRLLKEGGPELAPTSPSMYGGGPMRPSGRLLSLPQVEQQPVWRAKATNERMERFEAGIRTRVEAMPPEDRLDEEQVRQIVANGRSGLEKGEAGEEDKITQAEAASLEAVIETDGTRPSLFVANGFTDLNHNDVGGWYGLLEGMERGLRNVIAAVGRIRVDGSVQGTAFVIGSVGNDGLVITNRHVLQGIAKPVNGSQGWILNQPERTVIDFVGEDGISRSTKFRVTNVPFSGPSPIEEVDLKKLDLAVLKVDARSDDNFPEAVKFESRSVAQNHNLCVVGFPVLSANPESVIEKIFGNRSGVKRLAPGRVDLAIGEHEDDLKKWVFTHDASTLTGSSGSCVVDLGAEGNPVIGIHFGGKRLTENYAHAVGAAELQKELRAHNAVFV